MKQKFQNFMSGRYGVDDFSKVPALCYPRPVPRLTIYPEPDAEPAADRRPGFYLLPYVFQELFPALSGKPMVSPAKRQSHGTFPAPE